MDLCIHGREWPKIHLTGDFNPDSNFTVEISFSTARYMAETSLCVCAPVSWDLQP